MYTDENYIVKKEEGMVFSQLVYVGKEKVVHVPVGMEKDEGCFKDNKEIEEIIYTKGNKVADGFRGCSNLRKIYFSETIEKLGYYSYFGGCDALVDIEVDSANPFFTSKSGMILSKDEEKLIYCAPGMKGIVTVPDTVKVIGRDAFENCKSIETIILPEGLETIESSSFSGCKELKAINLPATIVQLPSYCFSGCSSLQTVDLSNVKIIGESAFSGCKAFKCKITSNVQFIAHNAFGGCNPKGFEFEEPEAYITAENKFGSTIFGSAIKVGTELKTYPNLPLELFEKPDLKQWIVMGFCTAPDLYSGYIKKQYEKYAKSQKKRILKKAEEGGYDKVLEYYGEAKPKETGAADAEGNKSVSLAMSAAEAKKYFKYSKRSTGISINEFKGIFAKWISQGNYESYFLKGVSNKLVLPDTIDGKTVGHIAHTMLPDDAVIFCNDFVFQKLKRTVRVSTACAYLKDATEFPDIEIEEIRKFIAKYPSDVAGKVIESGDVPAVSRFIELVKITPKLHKEMLEMATGKTELTAFILNQKGAAQKSKKPAKTEQALESLSLDQAVESKPFTVAELKKMWTYSTYTNPDNTAEKLVEVSHYKGLATKAVVPEKFGKSRLGRINGRLMEGHDDVTELILPEGEYEVKISLSNCRKLANPEGYIIVHAGDRTILTDYIGNKGVDKLVLPEGITEISSYAFEKVKMREVVVPAECVSINYSAFRDCERLQKVVIRGGLRKLESHQFWNCNVLRDIYVPDSVTEISWEDPNVRIHGSVGSEAEAFAIREKKTFIEYTGSEVTEMLSDYVISEGVLEKYVGNGGIVSLPTDVKTIKNSAFKDCSNIVELVISEGVETIEDFAFSRCSGLTKAHLSNSIKEIGSYAFSECYMLSQIEFPSELIIIHANAFMCCQALVDIKIPESVVTIEEKAFNWCRKLRKVYIPGTVKEIGEYAFPNDYQGADLLEIHAPSGSYAQEYAEKNHLRFVEEN